MSRSALWTFFDCKSGEKTRVYLERSRSSPIRLCFNWKRDDIPPHNPFLQIVPHATGRLKSLSIRGTQENLQVITPLLSYPAPLLERLSIDAEYGPNRHAAIPSTLFNGEFPSLRTLHLNSVCTELPWRNIINLTSFSLINTPPGAVSVEGLLDFFESAPYLREVVLWFVTPTTGVQHGRLVSLAYLKSMQINHSGPASVLLDHLLIPVGVELETSGELVSSLVGEVLPRSLNNLKNFSNFTAIQLIPTEMFLHMTFSGPNGKVSTHLMTSRADRTTFSIESLTQLDTSKTERFEIQDGEIVSWDLLYQTYLSMANLRTLTLDHCRNPHTFIDVLQPGMNSSEVMVCPRLEEFSLVLAFWGVFDITRLIEVVAARAWRGKKLRTIGIVNKGEDDFDVSELGKYVWNVEYKRDRE